MDEQRDNLISANAVMVLDIVEQILREADDPNAACKMAASILREITGAKAVLVLEDTASSQNIDIRHLVVTPKRRKTDQLLAIAARLVGESRECASPYYWKENGTESGFITRDELKELDMENVVVAPLCTGHEYVGCILLMGLPEDESARFHLLRALKMLTTTLGLIIKNALLFEMQEKIIESRTKKLKNSEELYRSLIETTSTLPWELDLKTMTYNYVGPQSQKLFGYSTELWTGYDFLMNVVHQDDKEEVIHNIKRHCNYELEYRIIDVSGAAVWVRDSVTIQLEQGKPVSLRGFIQDITSRKKREDAIDNILAAVSSGTGQEFFDEMVLQLEKTLNCDYAFIGKLCETDKKTIKTQSLYNNNQLVDNMEYDLEYTPCEEVINTGVCAYKSDVSKLFPMDTMLKEMEIEGYVGVPLYDPQSRTSGLMVIMYKQMVKDIDFAVAVLKIFAERTAAELERLQSETDKLNLQRYLSNVIDSMPFILICLDLEDTITQWNHKAYELTGLSTDEVRGKPLVDVFPHLHDKLNSIHEAYQTAKIISFIKESFDDNGKKINEDITIYPLSEGEIQGVAILIKDITEKVHLEKMMIEAEKMQSVGGLAAGMAHEINNPLGAISQGVQNIKRRLDPTKDKNIERAQTYGVDLSAVQKFLAGYKIDTILEGCTNACSKASTIVKNMLMFSRKSDSHPDLVNLVELVDKTIELGSTDYDMKKKYDFKYVDIVKEYDADLPMIFCCAGEIEQVLLNLFKNALQAMEEVQRENYKPQFHVRLEKEIQYVRIEISDNGPGISGNVREHIFEPFFTTKPTGVGTGLGLSVSYMIITQNHCGMFEVESKVGVGTTFIIKLPIL